MKTSHKTTETYYLSDEGKTVKGAAAFEHFVKESGYSYKEILDLVARDKIESICIYPLSDK